MARDNKSKGGQRGGRGGGGGGTPAGGKKITTGGGRPNVAGGRGGVQKSPNAGGRNNASQRGGRGNGAQRGGGRGGRGGRGNSEPKRNLGDLDAGTFGLHISPIICMILPGHENAYMHRASHSPFQMHAPVTSLHGPLYLQIMHHYRRDLSHYLRLTFTCVAVTDRVSVSQMPMSVMQVPLHRELPLTPTHPSPADTQHSNLISMGV